MKYLVKRGEVTNKTRAHIWDGDDTRCHRWSAKGGIIRDRYRLTDTFDGNICATCLLHATNSEREALEARTPPRTLFSL